MVLLGVLPLEAKAGLRRLVEQCARTHFPGGEIVTAPYFTDASVLTSVLGFPPTVILGPGEAALAHQTDEYCFISRVEQATELYSQLIQKWCAI